MLEFTLEGKDDRRADFADTAEFCRSLVDCLRRMHRVDHPGTSKLPRYRIQKLEIGSAVIGLSSDQSTDHAVVLLTQTLSSIRNRRQYDAPLNAEDIRAFRSLSDPLESQTSTIVVADVPIDAVFRESCEWMLAQAPKSLGQAIGRLEGMNVHNRSFFRLYPEGQDKGAECYFADDMYDKVHDAMKKRVQVRGMIHRDPDGVGIDRITQIEDIEVLPETAELPSLTSLFGLFESEPINRQMIGEGWD